MTTTSKTFTFTRMGQLIRYYLVVERKSSLIQIGGFCVAIILWLIIGQSINNGYLSWTTNSYIGAFLFFYIVGGVLFMSGSFSWLRSKESRFSFLMVPVSAFEKFTFEAVYRLIAYIVVVPFLFWFLANIEGAVYHMFEPEFVNFQFSISDAINLYNIKQTRGEEIWLVVNLGMLIFLLPFAGSTFFKKSPLPKTLLSLSTIVAAFFLYGLVLFNVLSLKKFHYNGFLFMRDDNHIMLFFGFFVFVTNIACMLVSYFNVKEKEV